MDLGGSKSFGKVLVLTLFILMVLVVVASYLLVLLMGYGFIFFTSEGLALSMQYFNFPVRLFFFLGFQTPISAGAVFSFIWIVYVLCFIAAWKWRESFHDVAGKSFSRPFRSLFGNFLFIMPLLSSMMFTAAWAIIYSQMSVGVPTGQPSWPEDTPLQKIFLNLAYAPASEELGFTIIPLGLFAMFYVLSAERNVVGGNFKLVVVALFYPEGAKRMAGLPNVGERGIWRGISVAEWAMILTTSIIFAVAHVISPVGWEVGKVTSAFVQGLFLTLSYLAYGFEAPILLHWFFDYYLFFFDPDIASRFFPTAVPVLSLILLLILALGIAGWIVFAAAGLSRLFRRRRTKQVLPAPPATLSS